MIFTRYIPFLFLIFLGACNYGSKIEVPLEAKNLFILDKVDKLPDSLYVKFPKWVKPGVECFGVVNIGSSTDDKPSYDFPIPCKIISFHLNGVKCKITENIYPYESFGCQVIGIRKGMVWIESVGDLFLTEVEAQASLDRKERKRKIIID